jgi:hypothetical protein
MIAIFAPLDSPASLLDVLQPGALLSGCSTMLSDVLSADSCSDKVTHGLFTWIKEKFPVTPPLERNEQNEINNESKWKRHLAVMIGITIGVAMGCGGSTSTSVPSSVASPA